MRFVSRTAMVCTGVLLVTTAWGAVAQAMPTPSGHQYQQVDIGTLGGAVSAATALNDRDEVVGWSALADPTLSHAFRWYQGTLTDLGTLPGGRSSSAVDINDKGDIVGSAQTADGTTHAALWQGGVLRDLGVPAGGISSQALGINNRGQVVGLTYTAGGTRGFLWQNGAFTDLGTYLPQAINDRGQAVVTQLVIGQTLRSYLWDNGVLTDLGSLGYGMRATAISILGDIVGSADLPRPSGGMTTHGFRWYRGTLTDLGIPAGGLNSTPTAVNSLGWTVGYFQTAPDGALFHSYLTRGDVTVDLTGSGVSPGIVSSINNRGHLAGLRSTSGGPPMNPLAVAYF